MKLFRVAVFTVGVALVARGSIAFADVTKPTCGSTVSECQKIVDAQAHQIAILSIKATDYLQSLVTTSDALETLKAEQKAAQIAPGKSTP